LNLSESKLPVGRQFSFTCPQCKHKNTAFIPAPDGSAPQPTAGRAADSTFPPTAVSQVPSAGPSPTPAADLPEPPAPESLAEVGEASLLAALSAGADERPRGMVVYDDESIGEMLVSKLEALGYLGTLALNMRDAAKQLKFGQFSIVLVQEDYYGATLSSNQLLRSIQNMDNVSRRGMLVALISPNMTTLDDLLAFSLSLDAVVNTGDLGVIDRILMSIIARASKFFSVYREMLTEHGLD